MGILDLYLRVAYRADLLATVRRDMVRAIDERVYRGVAIEKLPMRFVCFITIR